MRGRNAAAVCAVAALLCACSGGSDPQPTRSTTGTRAPTSPSPSVHTSRAPSPAEIRAQVTARVDKIIRSEPHGGVSVAELNTATGASFAAGAHGGMWTASTYKLLVLISLLQHDGPDYDDATAAAAIENSDNKAGYALFLEAGGNPGVTSTLHALGMRHTVMGISDPTFTRTSAPDFIKVLQALVNPGVLSKRERAAVLDLMRDVESDQRWGVGVVADKGTRFANKNGWLSVDNSNGPGETDNGLWAVNSVGIVSVHGQQVLMSIFTEHQPDYTTGVKLVEKLARTMAPAVSRP